MSNQHNQPTNTTQPTPNPTEYTPLPCLPSRHWEFAYTQRGCTCLRFNEEIAIGPKNFGLVIVCGLHADEKESDTVVPWLKELSGPQPAVFGTIYYSEQTIFLARYHKDWWATLLHEIGHGIAWSMGLDNTETEANFLAGVLRSFHAVNWLREILDNDFTYEPSSAPHGCGQHVPNWGDHSQPS